MNRVARMVRDQVRSLGNDSGWGTYEDVWYPLTDALFSTVAIINASGVEARTRPSAA